MEEQNQVQTTKRPWQTYLLIFIISIFFLKMGFNVLADMAGNIQIECVESALSEEQIQICKSSKTMASLVMVGILLLFYIFFTWKIFKGKKWVVILFTAQGVLTALSLLAGIFLGKISLFGIIFVASEIYALITCLKHPFYSKKK